MSDQAPKEVQVNKQMQDECRSHKVIIATRSYQLLSPGHKDTNLTRRAPLLHTPWYLLSSKHHDLPQELLSSSLL